VTATAERPASTIFQRPTSHTGVWSWITTVDHKRIGILYGYSAFIFMIIGGLEALLLRIHLASANSEFLSAGEYNAMFTMHGAIYLYLKTEGELQERLYGWMWRGFGCFLVCYLLATIATLVLIPRVTTTFADHPWAWSIVLLNILAIANIPRAIFQRRPGYAFLSSCGTIAALVCLFGMALYPNMVTSNPHPENSLTIYNAASSPMTQGIMAIIAAIGMPFVVTYTVIVYWTFRGKVQLGPHSY